MFMDTHTPGMYEPPHHGAALSQATLHKIMGDHERFLLRQRGARARLRQAKLDGLRLAGRDLTEADLSCASLVGADLRGANLTRASLNCADLRGADLRGARLDQADLRGATFKGANLCKASLDGADLRAASMLYLGDDLRFHGNAHHESPFGAVDFSAAALRNTSFRNAKLDNANFTDALMEGASFWGARLRNTCFRSAVMTGVHIEEMNLPPKSLQAALPAPTASAQAKAKTVMAQLWAHHEWFVTGGKKGRPATIDGDDLRPLADSVKGLCLAGLSAKDIIAVGVDFTGCALQAAKLDGADLRGARFIGADLSGTSFQKAKIAHASFRKAKIRDLKLCTGQVLRFQADIAEAPFGDAQIQSDTVLAGWTEQQGTC